MRLGFLVAVLALAAVFANAASFCNESARNSMLVPAVSDGKGMVILLEGELRPGSGVVYTAVTPLAGESTQESERYAVKAAASEAGADVSSCDVLFKLTDGGNAETVEGPSAGAAMALLTLAGLQGKSVRSDASITGSISENGEVGSVGGLLEKAWAVDKAGMKMLLVPDEGVETKFMLDAFSQRSGLAVVEVKDLNGAAEIMFAGEGTQFASRLSLEPRQIPVLRERNVSEGEKKFGAVVQGLAGRLNESIHEIDGGYAKEFLKGEEAFASGLMGQRYYYSGGNAAFLAEINARFWLESRNASEESVLKLLNESMECSQGISWRQETLENFEMLAGARQRAEWSGKKAREASEAGVENEAGLLQALYEAVYAQEWCNTARALNEEAGEGSDAVDEKRLEEVARNAIAEAGAALSSQNETDFEEEEWHLQSAQELLEKKEYAAAAFDALYAKSSVLAKIEAEQSGGLEEIRGKAGKRLEADYSSLWARVYQAHASYYLQVGEGNARNSLNALQLSVFAEEIEKASRRMKGGETQEEAKAGLGEDDQAGKIIVVACVGALLASALYFALKRGKRKRAARGKRGLK